MSAHRHLIVNADDFGLSHGVNAGIIEAHEHGIVTSASLMVRWDGAADAATYARVTPSLGVGLHLDLGEWRFEGGEWRALYEVVPPHSPPGDFDRAIREQLDTFRALVGRDPTHIDSHQHAHRREPAQSAAARLAREIDVPLRHHDSRQALYIGSFYGQTTEGGPLLEAIARESLLSILGSLPTGLSEMCCHPAATATDLPTATAYRDERVRELQVLTDPAVCDAVEAYGIRLCTFDSCVEAH